LKFKDGLDEHFESSVLPERAERRYHVDQRCDASRDDGGLASLNHHGDCEMGSGVWREGEIVFYIVHYDTYNTSGFVADSF